MLRNASRAHPRVLAGLLAGLVLSAIAPPVSAQLTLDRILASDELRPQGLPSIRWTPDGQRFTYVREAADGSTDLMAQVVRTGEEEVLLSGADLVPEGERAPIRIEGYDWSPDGRRMLVYTRSERVWRQNTKGIYYVLEVDSGRLTPLSVVHGWQQFAKFSPDGRRVGFVRDHDLFVVDLESGVERRLTHDGSDDIINGTFDWVYEEELGLRDGWRWSPDGARIAFWWTDQSGIKDFFMIDDLQLYSEPVAVPYPKAGEANSRVRVGTVDLESGAITWIDTGPNPDTYLARMEWSQDGALIVQRLNRHQNRLDVLEADPVTGAARTLFTEESETWVDMRGDLEWVDDRRFLWISDRDGVDRLYLYDRDGSVIRAVSPEDRDVTGLEGVDPEADAVYYTGVGDSPLRRALYRAPLDGGAPVRISSDEGTWQVDMAPGGAYWIGAHSTVDSPPAYALYDGDGEVVRPLVDNAAVRERLADADVGRTEFFTFSTSDGVDLNGWMIKPPDFDPQTRYPVVMYVYGGPGSQTVRDAWGGTRYLYHQLLAQRGFIVASVDGRGTGARGRDFKKGTYLELGKWETHDQIEAARHLASLPWVDASRIGIWGWSYGGYMTLLSLMEGSEVFSGGVSVAPVTDWSFYDTLYTERFMRTPQENPEGYRAGSPLHKASRIEDPLLLVHGTGDDNVHFQNSVQIVSALQEAGKQFDLMIYPNKTHSISGAAAQMHLYTLMLDWLQEHLGGARPAA